jgi:hypothetical protein
LRSSGNHSIFPGGQNFRAIDTEDYLIKNQKGRSDYDITLSFLISNALYSIDEYISSKNLLDK